MARKNVPFMRHLLGMETLDRSTIEFLFERANFFLNSCLREQGMLDILKGKIVANLFFEPSTRTRVSFEIAAKRLGAITLNPHMASSATVKGESLLDTIHVFEKMGTEIFVIRHSDNNTAQFIASELSGNACIINGGDGDNQHPSQALLDLFTIQRYKPDFANLAVAIVGDVMHSRVARSLIEGLKIMGTTKIHLIAPQALIPPNHAELGVSIFNSMVEGLAGCDVVMALRIQKERIEAAALPNPEKFHNEYGLTTERLAFANPDAIVMHPGPMNRGIEIDSDVADGPQSVIAEQVINGVAMRMAIMDTLIQNKQNT